MSLFIPLFCPVCDLLMSDATDADAFMTYECCKGCMFDFAEARKNDWLLGWRPTTDAIMSKLHERQMLAHR